MRPAQVDRQHYKNVRYLTQVRSITHWHQAKAVIENCPSGRSVLEVGPGTGHTTWLLNLWGMNVTTMDIDATLEPDLVADVTNIEAEDDSWDCVLAAEVLEHLPFELFEQSLREIYRVSRRSAVITLPAPLVGISLLWNLPLLNPRGWTIGIPYMRKHEFNGEHYWEMGKLNYGKKRIVRSLKAAGWKILRAYRPPPSLYTYFFVLEKDV